MPEQFTPNNNKIEQSEESIEVLMQEVLDTYPHINTFDPETATGLQSDLSALKGKFDALARGEFIEEGALLVKYNKYTNNLFYEFEGEKIKTTLGEILSGSEWGNKFNLDHTSCQDKNDGRRIYTKYLQATIKRETLDVLDKYILRHEIIRQERLDAAKQKAYVQIQDKNELGSRELVQSGVIAEKTMLSLLTRLSADKPHLGFEVINVNAYQDVEMKIDFIVRIQNKEKGVKTIVTKKVQFTISKEDRKLETKERQLAKFNDVILIQMPELTAQDFYKKWVNQKNSVAGPDVYIGKDLEDMILGEVLR